MRKPTKAKAVKPREMMALVDPDGDMIRVSDRLVGLAEIYAAEGWRHVYVLVTPIAPKRAKEKSR